MCDALRGQRLNVVGGLLSPSNAFRLALIESKQYLVRNGLQFVFQILCAKVGPVFEKDAVWSGRNHG